MSAQNRLNQFAAHMAGSKTDMLLNKKKVKQEDDDAEEDKKKPNTVIPQGEDFAKELMSATQPFNILMAVFEGQKDILKTLDGAVTGGVRRRRKKQPQQQSNDETPQSTTESQTATTSTVEANATYVGNESLQRKIDELIRKETGGRQGLPSYNQQQQNNVLTKNSNTGVSNKSSSTPNVELCSRCNPNPCKCPPSDCAQGGNPFHDLDSVMRKKARLWLQVPWGFVASALGIFSVADLPFRLTRTDPHIVLMFPNTASGFTFESVANALGFGTDPLINIPNGVVLANLPGSAAIYNGLYVLIFVSQGNYFQLLDLNWIENIKSPTVGSWIQIALGATASNWIIDTLEECSQRWTVRPSLVQAIIRAKMQHMWANGTKYQYYEDTEICVKRQEC